MTRRRSAAPRVRVTWAHFPGRGPEGKHCQDCRHWKGEKCHKAAEMNRLHLSDLGECAGRTRACKHLEDIPDTAPDSHLHPPARRQS